MDKQALSKGERTRQAILKAAEQFFLSQGYHATSMRQIAGAAGIAVGGIYNHFGSKEEIFAALLEQHQPYTDIVASLNGLPTAEISEMIESAARMVIRELMEDPAFFRLVLIDLQEFEGDTLFELASRIGPAVLALWSQIAASGQIRSDVPLPVLMRTFVSVLVFYALSENIVFKEGKTLFDWPLADEIDWIGGMVDVFLHGALR